MSRHIVILGPGRCGTTAFVRLMHNLGYDTGFEDEVVNAPRTNTAGGLEWPIRGSNIKEPAPYVVKQPRLGDNLPERAEKWGWKIDYAYILVRDLDMMLQSKEERVGGFTKEKLLLRREKVIRRVGVSLLSCVKMQIPYSIVVYPRWAADPLYCYWGTQFHRLYAYPEFKSAFNKTIDPTYLRAEEVARIEN